MTSQSASASTLPPLTAEQKARFEAVVDGSNQRLLRRARIVLLASDGLSTAQIAEQVGVSRSGVRYWLKRYRLEGVSILDSGQGGERKTDAVVGAVTVELLCARYSVDMAHARHVADQALRLFDGSLAVHSLAADARRMLYTAALLHNVAYELDPVEHHLTGRDILLKQPLEGFTKAECRMLACTTAFHRKQVDPSIEPAFVRLSAANQQTTLALAAVLRVADGLDYSVTQTTSITDIHFNDGVLSVQVGGEFADFNAARADKMADLWRAQFGVELIVGQDVPGSAARGDLHWAALTRDMTLPDAGRSLAGHYLSSIEAHAERVRGGEDECLVLLERDVERLLGVLRLFGAYFDATALSALKKDARWIQRSVSNVLEPLALMEILASGIDSANKRFVKALSKQFGAQAGDERRKLSKMLNGKRYRAFLTDMLGFSQNGKTGYFPGKHNKAKFVEHAALFVWQEMQRLRAEATSDASPEDRHRRIRRFHNVVQYTAELAGPELREVLVTLQPLEAAMRDLVLAEALFESIKRGAVPALPTKKQKKPKQDPAAQEALLAAWRSKMEELRLVAEAHWAAVDSVEFRRALALTVAVL